MALSVFPTLPGISWEVTKTPVWSTTIQTTKSGKELRLQNWMYPQWKFSLSYEFLRDSQTDLQSELKKLAGFFNMSCGQFKPFAYVDPHDCTIINQTLAIVTGTNDMYQVIRSYGGFVEPVKYLVPGSVNVYVNDEPIYYFTIIDNGIIKLTNFPGTGVKLSADCNFGYVCRFAQDEMDFRIFMKNLYEARRVELVTVK